MIDPSSSVRLAIDLFGVPSRAKAMRAQRLPTDVEIVLRLAGGEAAALADAEKATGRSPGFLRGAATFYVEQILLHPDADSYRVLGASSRAGADELRHNMSLLIQWLHTDRNAEEAREALAVRVSKAWDTVKTADRRAEYDRIRPRRRNESGAEIQSAQSQGSPQKGSRHRQLVQDLKRKGHGNVDLILAAPAPKGGMLRRAVLRIFSVLR